MTLTFQPQKSRDVVLEHVDVLHHHVTKLIVALCTQMIIWHRDELTYLCTGENPALR